MAESIASTPARRTGPIPVVFAGSSSIALWSDLAATFPSLPVVNRGIGGTWLSDLADLAPGLVLSYEPDTVVVYAGENDLGAGQTVESVVAAFQRFREQLRASRPNAHLVFLALKPSLYREKLLPAFEEANRQIAAACQADSRCTFVDVFTPMLNPEGRPRAELFIEDGLHMNEAGYKLWTDLLAPVLAQAIGR